MKQSTFESMQVPMNSYLLMTVDNGQAIRGLFIQQDQNIILYQTNETMKNSDVLRSITLDIANIEDYIALDNDDDNGTIAEIKEDMMCAQLKIHADRVQQICNEYDHGWNCGDVGDWLMQ